MKLKKIIPLFAIALGLVLAVATSGFKEAPIEGQNPYFYEYVGTDFTQQKIEDPDNYIRSAISCSGSYDVCGVFLTTDQGLGNPADPTDFNSQQSNLWLSQQNHTSVDVNVSMEQ